MQTREQAFDADGGVGFPRVLRRTMRGKALLIWEGSPIHTGKPITQFLARDAATRPHLERLPGYAPDRNPDEDSWTSLTRVELRNRCCAELAGLDRELRRANVRLRHTRAGIRACSLQCGYSV